jgi:hypothetical protein
MDSQEATQDNLYVTVQALQFILVCLKSLKDCCTLVNKTEWIAITKTKVKAL